MKYEDEYLKCETKEDFIKEVSKKYNIKESSAERRYYDLKKEVNKKYEHKYEKEYLETTNKQDFIKLVLKRYNIKQSSAERRFYDLRKIINERINNKQVYQYSEIEKKQPNVFKMRTFNDLKDYYGLVPKHILIRHGFTQYEMNWLEDNGKM